MNKILLFCMYICFVLLSGCNSVTENFLSPSMMAVDNNNNKLYITDETANRISVVNTLTKKPEYHIKLDGNPGGIVLSQDCKKAYVTLAIPEGRLLEVDLDSHEVSRKLEVGHTPMSPVITDDGKLLYFCNRYNNNICMVDLKKFSMLKSVEADREPVSLVLVPENNKLLVANNLPSGRANDAYYSSKILIFNSSNLEKISEIVLPNGSNAVNAVAVSPDSKYAYATHIVARYNIPTNQLERGWINTNALTIIDLSTDEYLCTVLLDDIDRGAANPFDVKCSDDGKLLFVTHSGTDELSIIDRHAMHARIREVETGSANDAKWYARSLSEIKDDLSFLQDIRERIPLYGKGPKGIALSGDKVYVAMYYSGVISEVSINNQNGIFPASFERISYSPESGYSKGDNISVSAVGLGKQPEMTAEREGEIWFHDASVCKQQWQSCASCHPGDARADALNWDLLNDGIGNPKNTKSLLLSHATPPAMITGIRAKAEVAVRAGFEHIFFTIQPEDLTVSVDKYLISLKPVTSPFLVNGEMSASALRGEKVFQKAGCVMCHSGSYHTNMIKYDVGTGTGREKGVKFDTPALTEIWRTAPYLYDGRAKDMEEVLTIYNENDKHGHTSELSDSELDDLINYCLSL